MKPNGLRFGTPAITTRGLGKAEVSQLSEWIDTVLMSNGDEAILAKVAGAVTEMCSQYPIPNSVNQ